MADVINPAYLSMPAQVQKNKDDIEALRNSAIMATPEGQYSAATTYGKGALVAYTDGNIYYHFSDIETRGVPPTDIATWVLYQEGIPGPQGEQGIQGLPGNNGKDGVTPDITATATVSNTTGTPSVNVSKGGTAENPSFAFAFQNIKGEPGAPGPTGSPGADGLPALTYGGTANFSTSPIPGTNINLGNASFNRTPEVGDRFLAFSVYSTNNYICGLRITSVGGTNSSATVETYSYLSGNNKKYHHALTFQLTDSNYPTAYISLSIINDSSSMLTSSNIGEAIRAYNGLYNGSVHNIPANGVMKISDSPTHSVFIVYVKPVSTTSWQITYGDPDDFGTGTRIYQSSIGFTGVDDIVTPLS